VSAIAALSACAPGPPLVLGPTEGSVHICASEFAEPMTYGSVIAFTDAGSEATLVSAALVRPDGVRVIEQAAARAVLLDDGTHLGIGTTPVADGDEAWDARVPLNGTVIRDDGGETWFLALALERTSAEAGGFEGVELTYLANGREQRVVSSAESFSFPATGDACDE
jgi:hypothetical protein